MESKINQPTFWQDRQQAEKIISELTALQKEVKIWDNLEDELNNLKQLIDLSQDDLHLKKEIATKLIQLDKELRKEEIKIFLNGLYDIRNAVLSIYAGAGGTEAQDWAEMLLRMYLHYAEHKNWQAQVVEITPGQEAGIKNAVVEIKGRFAYGYLKKESGTHRLVRLSPFNADHLRHTSFALVEVLPEFDKLKDIVIRPEDLKVDTYRASGPGGQYVNKTESAVRITHLPTGISVACQSERLQGENKSRALKILYTKLFQYYQSKQEREKKRLKGQPAPIEWGQQIRSYILHPYKLVKDHRTGFESKHPDKILDGYLDGFIEAELKWQIKNK